MKKQLLILVIFIFSISFCGCSLVEAPNNLIVKPSSYINMHNLDGIMSVLIKEGKTLTIPMGDKKKQSIREVDLDNDGKNELVLLYKKDDDYSNYGIIILKQNSEKNNNWEVLIAISFVCKNIDFVDFKDLTGDGKPEILVGVTNSKDTNKSLSIYSYHKGFFETLCTLSYIDTEVHDINNDGKNELALLRKINKNTELSINSLEIYRFKETNPILIDTFEFKHPIIDMNMKLGKASKDTNGIFVTLNMDNKKFYTDLFILKDNRLNEVFNNETSQSIDNIKTLQNYNILSNNKTNISLNNNDNIKDINNDGILELKILKPLNNYTESIVYPCNIICWYQWDCNKNLNLCHKEYNNTEYNYSIYIPECLNKDIKVLENIKEDQVINRVDFFNKKGLIFSLKIFYKKCWEKQKFKVSNKNYVILKEDSDKIYIGMLNNKNTNLTKNKLKILFK